MAQVPPLRVPPAVDPQARERAQVRSAPDIRPQRANRALLRVSRDFNREEVLTQVFTFGIKSQFRFHLNPTTITERIQPKFEEKEAVNSRIPNLQFKSGGPRFLKFTFMLNDWGAEDLGRQVRDAPEIQIAASGAPGFRPVRSSETSTVAQAIEFLRRVSRPLRAFIAATGGTTGFADVATIDPPVLEFLYQRERFVCRLIDIEITTVAWNPVSGLPIRANVSITLREFQGGRFAEDLPPPKQVGIDEDPQETARINQSLTNSFFSAQPFSP